MYKVTCPQELPALRYLSWAAICHFVPYLHKIDGWTNLTRILLFSANTKEFVLIYDYDTTKSF